MITTIKEYKLIKEQKISNIYLYRYHPIADMENVMRNGLQPYTQKSMSDRAWDSGDAEKWGWDEDMFDNDEDEFDDPPRIFFTPEEWPETDNERIPLRVKKSDIEYEIHPDENLPPDVYLEGENVEVSPGFIEVKINKSWVPLLSINKSDLKIKNNI